MTMTEDRPRIIPTERSKHKVNAAREEQQHMRGVYCRCCGAVPMVWNKRVMIPHFATCRMFMDLTREHPAMLRWF
jgi:hypothetical protein